MEENSIYELILQSYTKILKTFDSFEKNFELKISNLFTETMKEQNNRIQILIDEFKLQSEKSTIVKLESTQQNKGQVAKISNENINDKTSKSKPIDKINNKFSQTNTEKRFLSSKNGLLMMKENTSKKNYYNPEKFSNSFEIEKKANYYYTKLPFNSPKISNETSFLEGEFEFNSDSIDNYIKSVKSNNTVRLLNKNNVSVNANDIQQVISLSQNVTNTRGSKEFRLGKKIQRRFSIKANNFQKLSKYKHGEFFEELEREEEENIRRL